MTHQTHIAEVYMRNYTRLSLRAQSGILQYLSLSIFWPSYLFLSDPFLSNEDTNLTDMSILKEGSDESMQQIVAF